MQGCTFKPVTNNYEEALSKTLNTTRQLTNASINIGGHHRRKSPDLEDISQATIHQNLFEISKSNPKLKEDRRAADIEFEKSKEECTFKPDVS
mmetsp:Transcript_20703/g.19736  ORF Transcript_20703/g.19736 Transcript_20703/m.19736 type:complete len:93 (-) Transcript_20703:209-487(-)